jgi:hypothetical protein
MDPWQVTIHGDRYVASTGLALGEIQLDTRHPGARLAEVGKAHGQPMPTGRDRECLRLPPAHPPDRCVIDLDSRRAEDQELREPPARRERTWAMTTSSTAPDSSGRPARHRPPVGHPLTSSPRSTDRQLSGDAEVGYARVHAALHVGPYQLRAGRPVRGHPARPSPRPLPVVGETASLLMLMRRSVPSNTA